MSVLFIQLHYEINRIVKPNVDERKWRLDFRMTLKRHGDLSIKEKQLEMAIFKRCEEAISCKNVCSQLGVNRKS